jgi:nitrate/nitrite-specific signal transduction histidine kinase
LWANIRLHRGPRVKLKDRGLGLKSNKNKYTHVGLNILGLNMRPKYRAFQYGFF